VKLGLVPGLISVPEGADPIIARIEKSAQKGLNCMGVFLRPEMRDAANLERAAELASQKGVELRLGTGGNLYAEGDEMKKEVERIAEGINFAAKHLGIRFSSVAPSPMTMHRWAPGLPLEERKRRASASLAQLGDAVAPNGVTLGLENHCDWRGHECVEMIEGANRPNVRAQIDTGNAFTVFEEPVDCAKAMAPYVMSFHLKDVAVTPFVFAQPGEENVARGIRGVGVPLGDGHVDNVEICRIVQKTAPNPESITLIVEPLYLDPGTDVDAYADKSIAWARKHLAEFLT
jgi:sugar phosphate isomerase/epimerase